MTVIGRSLLEGFSMFWDTLWALVLGFGLSGAVQAFVSRRRMRELLGNHRPGTIVRASLLGAASSSCSYAASALARTLFGRGADFTTSIVFMLASTNLVVELGIVLWLLAGWQFAVAEFVGGAIMVALFGLISPRVFRGTLLADARRHAESSLPADASSDVGDEPLRQRVRHLGNWADAASYTISDLRMLRRELLIGFVVAGFLGAGVPDRWFRDVFLTGHGATTTVLDAVIGPVVAFISFVCSIGNVPLAAALWTGGVSFGGVVAFVFADLLTAPLVVIYRKLYGGRAAAALVAVLWFVMSVGGLLTELIFRGVHLLPHAHRSEPVGRGIHWNYTTFLDVVALLVFAAVWWLSRNRDRFGGGERYATDPMCGMQVEIANPGAAAEVAGQRHYFCCDGCRDGFVSRSAEPASRH